ncbi:MAG TPA: hypothetical protein VEW71_07035 [Allosphingosinicella sp.]|nr:hypothetical protein [Allosphingosinicella sp.]
MPRPDPIGPYKGLTVSISAYALPRPPKKRPRRKGGEAEREPVESPNPRPLSGGAAAALEFDD